MELQFSEKKYGNGQKYYEATAVVAADFNLHVERKKSEILQVYVTTVPDSEYSCAFTDSAGEVFDHDFDGIVYPKYIKVQSWSEPTMAVITESNE